jgi:hypothetical protein
MDPAARLICLFELAGWATKVRWPTPTQVARLRIKSPVDSEQAVDSAQAIAAELLLVRNKRSLGQVTSG